MVPQATVVDKTCCDGSRPGGPGPSARRMSSELPALAVRCPAAAVRYTLRPSPR